MPLDVPQVDALHVWRDAWWDGCEVAESAVHLGGDVAGAEPGTGGAAGQGGQAGTEEDLQPPGSASVHCCHPAAGHYNAILHSDREPTDSYKETKHKQLWIYGAICAESLGSKPRAKVCSLKKKTPHGTEPPLSGFPCF